jgi:hypothetical protein
MTKSPVETPKIYGPSGFIEIGGQMLVVDYGKIYLDGSPIGFLYEDGVLKETSGPLGMATAPRAIDEISGCIFRGIDTSGLELELPGVRSGPTGSLKYNGMPLNVINGRLSTQEHHLVGEFDDDGAVYIRDHTKRTTRRKLDESTQLSTFFQGRNSKGQNWDSEFQRPMHKKDKTYSENEIFRYFENFDALNAPQKKYVIDSLKMWAACGLLQIVRKSEGNAALGNVKHGAAGATGVRSGQVNLDREEFEKEVMLIKRFGVLATVQTQWKQHCEVRLNLVVSHEYGHQLEFILSQASQDRIEELYNKRLKQSERLFPAPAGYEGTSELVPSNKVFDRLFISGYGRQSKFEYWAESAAAFSLQESREVLRELDPDVSDFLQELVLSPEKMVRAVHVDQILDLQASLRVGDEFKSDLLDT